MWCRDVVAAYFNRLTGRTIETKYFGRRLAAENRAPRERAVQLGCQSRRRALPAAYTR